MRECRLNLCGKKIIGVSAFNSWEKAIISRHWSPEEFLSKGQNTVGGGGDHRPLRPYRVNEMNQALTTKFLYMQYAFNSQS